MKKKINQFKGIEGADNGLFFWKNLKFDPLFNGNNNSDNHEFDNYLKRLGYSFKNNDYEFSNYVSLKDKKINLIMDVGSSPIKKYSEEYLSLIHI